MGKEGHKRVVVVGAGVGGLATAALLARKGFDVTVFERQGSPGGCASTFMREGYRFDAGATVGCGFQKNGPLDILGAELGIRWPLMNCPVAWQYVSADVGLELSASKQQLLERFPSSRFYWEEQERVASLLWRLSSDVMPWPPAGFGDYRALIAKAFSARASALPLFRLMNASALQWLSFYGLESDPAFLRFIDAQLLISVQATAEQASALNAAIALDLPARGTHRLTGGIGRVAGELARSLQQSGGRVFCGRGVSAIRIEGKRAHSVTTDDGETIAADIVVANVMPEALDSLLGKRSVHSPGAGKTSRPEWSAFVLYLGVAEKIFSGAADHMQVVEPDGPLGEGRSIFVSVSPSDDSLRAPEGYRAVTVSTHTRPGPWFEAHGRGKEAYAVLRQDYISRIVSLLSSGFPGVESAIELFFAATPVTWERFSGRPKGFVGGYPQTSLFGVRGPQTPCGNLFLVGDSVFPGQSLPGVVTGARRVVDLVRRKFGDPVPTFADTSRDG
ncbi:amine oxidase [Prosthecochloris sp. GSB1]|uniref:phytoene desaturase family protein n=1 Tax=Prosthecochloris sp. GSB1 TaxID=281093 RepID=UPI000B8CF5E9|nr:NAD(P)/FAD-dependent oxidoreductase [Prosthecochloris sp. GSB1]ASQ89801.1 amine oxidase [Prosthecochloris sp. GSB1]